MPKNNEIHKMNRLIEKLEKQRAGEISFLKELITKDNLTINRIRKMADKRLGVIMKNGK